MASSELDEDKAQKIADRAAQIVSKNDTQGIGPRVLQAISEHRPNALTMTGALLSYTGSDWSNDSTRDRVRMLMLAYRDQLLAQEQIAVQERLSQSATFLSWAAITIATLGAMFAGWQIYLAFVPPHH